MIPKPCLVCRKPTRFGARCEQHQREYLAARDRRRGSSTERGYDSAYQKARSAAIRATPYCQICYHTGSVDNPLTADHIVPLSLNGTNDIENLRVLCRYHNSQRGNQTG